MQPTVRIGFDLNLSGTGPFFTLNDPVKGVLDNVSFVLAEDALTDVSADVRSVSVRRGRSDETTNVDAAAANIVLDNRLRLYDPTAPASVSPYGPSILPRKEIVVRLGNQTVFTGQVEDWDLNYTPGGESTTTAKAGDGFTLLAEANLASGAGATGLSSSVIYETASAANWPMSRLDLDQGTASVGVHTIQNNQKALPYLQKISNTEQGLIFVGKDGTLTFRDRISPRRNVRPLFADDGTGIPFQNIEIVYGTEFLYTQVEVTYPGGSASAVSASPSIVAYGLRSYSLDTFLPDGTEAGVIAAFLAGRYGEPTFKIVGLQVQFDSLTQAQRDRVLDLELGDGVEVLFTPNGIGDPIFRELAVDGIQHDIRPGVHVMSFRLFDPFLVANSGSVEGSVGEFGEVEGFKGTFGVVDGVSGSDGAVEGVKGTVGVVAGVNGSEGTVVGTVATSFILDTSLLDTGVLG